MPNEGTNNKNTQQEEANSRSRCHTLFIFVFVMSVVISRFLTVKSQTKLQQSANIPKQLVKKSDFEIKVQTIRKSRMNTEFDVTECCM